MVSFIVLCAIAIAVSSDRVVIRPDTNNPFITTYLTPDPRGINKINNNNKWRVRGSSERYRRLKDWALTMTLDANQYGFETNSANSTLSITMRSFCTTAECDAFFAFQIGDNEYITFVTDFDGYFETTRRGGNTAGISIYPECGGNIASGDASGLVKQITNYRDDYSLRDGLAGDGRKNWYRLTKRQQGRYKPEVITFEFINNDIDDTFTFRFGSETFKMNQIECAYNAVSTGKEFKLYMTPDWHKENIIIRSFVVNGDKYRGNKAERLEAMEEDLWEVDEDEFDYERRLYEYGLNGQGYVL